MTIPSEFLMVITKLKRAIRELRYRVDQLEEAIEEKKGF